VRQRRFLRRVRVGDEAVVPRQPAVELVLDQLAESRHEVHAGSNGAARLLQPTPQPLVDHGRVDDVAR
jgi:hypothetical protein